MKKNTVIIFLLFFIANIKSDNLVEDSTCNTTCDLTELSSSCNSLTEIAVTTSLNSSDSTLLPVNMAFTTPEVLNSSSYSSITNSLAELDRIIQFCRTNHYLKSPDYGVSGTYATHLTNIRNKTFMYILNDNDNLLLNVLQSWNDNIISKDFVKIEPSNQQLIVVSAATSGVRSSISNQQFSATDLNKQQCILTAQQNCLSNVIECLNTEVSQQNQNLEIARQNAFTAFSNADIFIRGRLGSIINTSSISYQLIDSKGNVLDTIVAGQTSKNSFALSDYANSQQGGIFTLVPYDGIHQVGQDGSGEAFAYGGTLTILCNSVGMNEPGNPYGFAQSISVTRVYPAGATRAHVVDVSSFVEKNQYWEFNITINPLPANQTFVYPRISKISTVTKTLDVTQDLPLIGDVKMKSSVEIQQSNSSVNTYPGFDQTLYWSDVPA